VLPGTTGAAVCSALVQHVSAATATAASSRVRTRIPQRSMTRYQALCCVRLFSTINAAVQSRCVMSEERCVRAPICAHCAPRAHTHNSFSLQQTRRAGTLALICRLQQSDALVVRRPAARAERSGVAVCALRQRPRQHCSLACNRTRMSRLTVGLKGVRQCACQCDRWQSQLLAADSESRGQPQPPLVMLPCPTTD
jgi:hypothetical protein